MTSRAGRPHDDHDKACRGTTPGNLPGPSGSDERRRVAPRDVAPVPVKKPFAGMSERPLAALRLLVRPAPPSAVRARRGAATPSIDCLGRNNRTATGTDEVPPDTVAPARRAWLREVGLHGRHRYRLCRRDRRLWRGNHLAHPARVRQPEKGESRRAGSVPGQALSCRRPATRSGAPKRRVADLLRPDGVLFLMTPAALAGRAIRIAARRARSGPPATRRRSSLVTRG